MTKKDILECFNDINFMYNDCSKYDTLSNLLDELDIKTCEDCISRAAITDTTICEGISCNECSFNTCEDGQSGCLLHERVGKLPSVRPKTKAGHWMDAGNRGYADVDSDNIILYQEMCNRCKCLSYFRKSSGLLIGAKYCPNCGAKMESEV